MQTFHQLRTALLGAAVLGVALGTAAHAQSVSTDYDRHANFEQYHTFSFYKVQTADPLYEGRIKDEISRDLQARGWQMVPTGGDVAVTAIGNVKSVEEYNTFYNGLGGGGYGWRGWGGFGGGFGETATTTQRDIPVGTLLIDLYDNSTHNLVFRGRSTADLHKHEEKNIALVNKSIDKIFDKFPPKS